MATTPLISIVIAVYNIEDYLEPCLKSVLSQTYKNLEILAINDGSTDDSPKILKTYAKKYPRLKVINQKNLGLSEVRNRGIALSKGEYICFIDGDDAITPDFVAKLYRTIPEAGADISVCGYISVSETSQKVFTPKSEVLSGKAATTRLLIEQENLDIVTWNKLYKRELFLKNGITFPSGQLHEDSLTTYKLYSRASKVAFLDEALYFYYDRPGSIMSQSKTLNRLKSRAQAAREAVAYLSDTDLKSPAEISLLLAHFAYLDSALKGEIPKSYVDKSISWIKAHARPYQANPSLTKKLRLYLWLTTHFHAKPYILFRKITH